MEGYVNLHPKPTFGEYNFRVRFQYRQWIGKSDPSGFGKHYHLCHTRLEVIQAIERRTKNGHKLLGVEKSDGSKWVRMVPPRRMP